MLVNLFLTSLIGQLFNHTLKNNYLILKFFEFNSKIIKFNP